MFPKSPYSLESDLSIKRDYDRYGYRNAYYHIYPDGFYPRMSYSPLLKRNGFRKRFHDFNAEDVFTHLLSDNNFETLWKVGGSNWLTIISETTLYVSLRTGRRCSGHLR